MLKTARLSILAALPFLLASPAVFAQSAPALPGTHTATSPHGFDALAMRLEKAIEAPLRIYVTEDAEGKASVTWRAPTAVFAPYANAELNTLARELDPIVEKIVRDAVGNS